MIQWLLLSEFLPGHCLYLTQSLSVSTVLSPDFTDFGTDALVIVIIEFWVANVAVVFAVFLSFGFHFIFFGSLFSFARFSFFYLLRGGRNNHWEIFDNRHQNFLLAHGIQTFRKLSLWMNDFCRLVRLPKHIKSIKVSPSHRFYAWHHTFALKFSFPHHF